jgi:multidrug efflux pump subunit AcrA (membrane-fusion protein)
MFVPTGALESNAQSWFVYRYRSSSFGYPSVERVEVSVGIKNRDFAQITSGLNEGDSVVLYPPEKIKDGSRVSVYVPNATTP